MKRGGSDLT